MRLEHEIPFHMPPKKKDIHDELEAGSKDESNSMSSKISSFLYANWGLRETALAYDRAGKRVFKVDRSKPSKHNAISSTRSASDISLMSYPRAQNRT